MATTAHHPRTHGTNIAHSPLAFCGLPAIFPHSLPALPLYAGRVLRRMAGALTWRSMKANCCHGTCLPLPTYYRWRCYTAALLALSRSFSSLVREPPALLSWLVRAQHILCCRASCLLCALVSKTHAQRDYAARLPRSWRDSVSDSQVALQHHLARRNRISRDHHTGSYRWQHASYRRTYLLTVAAYYRVMRRGSYNNSIPNILSLRVWLLPGGKPLVAAGALERIDTYGRRFQRLHTTKRSNFLFAASHPPHACRRVCGYRGGASTRLL